MKALVVGHFSRVLGLGKDALAVLECLEFKGIPTDIYDVDYKGNSSTGYNYDILNNRIFDCVPNRYDFVVYALPPAMAYIYYKMLNVGGKAPCSILYTPLEIESLNKDFECFIEVFHGVIVNSAFIESQLKAARIPNVFIWKTYVKKIESLKTQREVHSDKISVLASFDANSRITRKNGDLVIYCFRKLAAKWKHVLFTVKTINAGADHRLRCHYDSENLEITDGFFTEIEYHRLLASHSIFFSPHRAEGFGRIIAECMSYGLLAVATNATGNLEYMNKDNSLLIESEKRRVPSYAYPSISGNCYWHEPSEYDALYKLDSAIRLYEEYESLRKNAEQTMIPYSSLEASSGHLLEIITQLLDGGHINIENTHIR